MKLKKKITPIFIMLVALIGLLGVIFIAQSYSDKINPIVDVTLSEYDYAENKTLRLEDGKPTDWIEIYNNSDFDVELKGFRLFVDNVLVYTIDNKIVKAKSYYVIDNIDLDFNKSQKIKLLDRKRRELFNVKVSSSYLKNTIKTPGFSNDEKGIEAYLSSITDLNTNSLVINEVCAKNVTQLMYNDQHLDWIEIKNISNEDINLNGYILTDTKGVFKWEFKDTILKANDITVIYASGNDNEKETNFKLDKENGYLALINPLGRIISTIDYNLQDDQVIYRNNDGEYIYSYLPTLGYENNNLGLMNYYQDLDKERTSDILIWEVLSRNGKYNVVNNKYYDMIEIKNVSNHDVNLKDYYLTDNANYPFKNQLPDYVLKPNKIYTFYASQNSSLGNNHLNFNINDEETVLLFKNGYFMDGICSKETYLNISIGRKNNEVGFFYFINPSITSENNTTGYRGVSHNAEIVTKSGIYHDTKQLNVIVKGNDNIASDNNCVVYYTTDGSDPTNKSKVFPKDGLTISCDTIVKTMVVQKGLIDSQVVSGSYFIDEKHDIDVVSITMDPLDFDSDERGIYSYGYNYSEKFPYSGANFWKKWEREAQVELLALDGSGFDTRCGMMIFGAYSRGYSKKSFRLNFRSRYDTGDLEYDVFGSGEIESFNKLVIRSGGQDEYRAMMRDELFTSLAGETTDLLVQRYRPVALYINGNYWGLYYIREKIDDEFVSKKTGYDPSSLTILHGTGSVDFGSNQEYNDLIHYVLNHDLRKEEYYKYVESKVDFVSLIDYSFAQYFISGSDLGNVRYYKSTDPNSDNKWHWMLFDTDLSMVIIYKGIDYFFGPNGAFKYTNTLINSLLKNDKFKQLFFERASYNLHVTFEKQKVLERLNDFEKLIDNEIHYEANRWNKFTYDNWKNNKVKTLRDALTNRYSYVVKEMKNYFHLTDQQVIQYFDGIE